MISLNYLVGVIDKDDSIRFKRIIFRVTKGNAWTDFIPFDSVAEIKDPKTVIK